MRTLEEELEFAVGVDYTHETECPICGEELVMIDDTNYITMICPDCHSTVFEEFDNTIHVIRNGIMDDGYNASLDIFYKQFLVYTMHANTLSQNKSDDFWAQISLKGLLINEDIMADGIYDYFHDKIDGFKLKPTCIYFDGYKKYLEIAKPDIAWFKREYYDKLVGDKNR